MSNSTNQLLIERARDIAEMYTGTPLEQAILNNIDSGDLEVVAQLVKETEDYLRAEADLEMDKLHVY